ncbi:hypothetical protein BRD00_08095 [Halobacteriales archaeon QS_8_69_26]|nr:MAG: hypothetical protein BRD00_08095 [Halobacteriales archaeon QS_8_69_26]
MDPDERGEPSRRRYLAGAAAGLLGGIAGCLGRGGGNGPVTTAAPGDGGNGGTDAARTEAGTPPGNRNVNAIGADDVDLPVPEDDLHRGAGKNDIPAITKPAFGEDWSTVDGELAPENEVIGVERGGEARAYPLRILNWHEIVNDALDGPILVTYCPLCGSGMTAKRVVDGEATTFGVSGFLYRSDLVMYDEATDSLWSQIVATAIRGPKTGTELELLPSSLTTLGAWREDHPDTAVLLPPPESETIVPARPRNYSRDPYAGYEDSQRVGIGRNGDVDGRLHPKTTVIGVSTDDAAKAYPYEAVTEAGVVSDTVGDLPVVVAAGPEGSLFAYVREFDGETVTFEPGSDGRMVGADSEWTITTGEAVSGPYEGWRLDQASGATTMFWFAWADFNPDTDIYEP